MKTLSHLHHKIYILALICFSVYNGNSQHDFNGEIITVRTSEMNTLNQVFTTHTEFEFEVSAFHDFVWTNSNLYRFNFAIGNKYNWSIDLSKNEMRAFDYVSEQTGESGRISVPRTECITYAGNITGSPNLNVRLNIEAHRMWGYISGADGVYFIEPLNRFIDDVDSDKLIVYEMKSVIPQDGYSCGASGDDLTIPVSRTLQPVQRMMTGDDCRKVEIATESDWEFYDDGETFSDIQGNLNMVEGIYQSYFNMTFLIVYQHQWTTSGDPYTNDLSGCSNYGEMNEFADYWYHNFTHIRRNTNILYSGKNYESTAVGCGFTGTFGDSYDNDGVLNNEGTYQGAYCVNMWDVITDTRRMRLVAHEVGHTFGANHDDSNCGIFEFGNIMCSNLSYASSEFLPTAIAEIEAGLNYESDEPNDGRSALRIRDFPINTQEPGLVITDFGQATGNQWIMDSQINFGILFLPPQPFTFKATQDIKLKPGFHVAPTGNYALKLNIGDCDINGL